jgi:ABC-2 type transport system permease protein
MKQFITIFKFESQSYFRNKAFVGVTLFLVVLIAAVMFFPRVMVLFDKEDQTAPFDRPVLYLVADTADHTQAVQQAFAAAFSDYDVQVTEQGIDWLQEQITSGAAECAFVLDSLTSYTYYVDDLSMYDSNTEVADAVLQELYQVSALVDSGLSPDLAAQILTAQVEHTTTSLGKDQMQNFFYTYIMIFALYMVILLYGQMVASNVAAEKSSRAMELLITSAQPTHMMFGKVLASCLAGLIQLAAVFGAAFLFFNLNKSAWEGNWVVTSIFDMPGALLAYLLLFFVLGFLLYAFLFGAIGSTVSKLEDISTAVMPVTLLFVIAFIVVMFSLSSSSVDNLILVICSFIPFTSPMAMFTRIAMSTVPLYQILLSIALLAVGVGGVGVLSAKIYRVGVLLYGTPPKPAAIWKAIRRA